MAVCTDFTSSGNALGLTLENGTAMNIKKEVYRIQTRTGPQESVNASSAFICAVDH